MPVMTSGFGADARDQAGRRGRRGGDDRRRHRQERQAGLDRREAERVLQVEGQEQEDAEHARAGQAHRQVGAAAPAVEHDPQRQQRVLRAHLDQHERDQQHRGGGEHDDRQRVAPAGGLGVREAVDEREQAGRGGDRARDVEARAVRRDDVVQQRERGDRGRDREQQVHVEAPAPGGVLGEQAAEQQADRGAAAGDRAEDAERLGALGRVGEGGGQQAERGGREQRAEDALGGAGGDEDAEALGGAADR